MEIYDISVPISSKTHTYTGDPEVEITPASRISNGQSANVSMLKFGSHTATHVDPPYHFFEDGKTIDELPLDILIGRCMLCEIKDETAIGIPELERANITDDIKRILFKTRNSELWNKPEFDKDFVFLDPDAAAWLVNRGIQLVGIDYLSIDRFKSGTHPTHIELLTAGVVIIEGLNFSGVPEGFYKLVCLPLKIAGGDGGPSRAVLIKD